MLRQPRRKGGPSPNDPLARWLEAERATELRPAFRSTLRDALMRSPRRSRPSFLRRFSWHVAQVAAPALPVLAVLLLLAGGTAALAAYFGVDLWPPRPSNEAPLSATATAPAPDAARLVVPPPHVRPTTAPSVPSLTPAATLPASRGASTARTLTPTRVLTTSQLLVTPSTTVSGGARLPQATVAATEESASPTETDNAPSERPTEDAYPGPGLPETATPVAPAPPRATATQEEPPVVDTPPPAPTDPPDPPGETATPGTSP